MSFEDSEVNVEVTEVRFDVPEKESSEDPPMDECSLNIYLPNENKVQRLHSPGSGDICTKYVSMSASSILGHPYYNYPAVLDPGIVIALLDSEDEVIWPSDGQDVYLAICKDMNQCPVRIFHRGLLSDTINLRYYCVDPYGVRPMAIALKNNRYVTVLDLTDNFLNEDSCFHLGDMLKSNLVLTQLILAGCRIGALGAKKIFEVLFFNTSLRVLNLNGNEIGDTGVEYLADAVIKGTKVQQMLLRYNNVSGKSADSLVEAFEAHNTFTHLDLSWNNYCSPGGTHKLIACLGENNFLQDLNLSWNALSGVRIAAGIKSVLKAPNLRHLDLSNNRLNGPAITTIIENLMKATKLVTLNLSYNPLNTDDAVKVLKKMKYASVKVRNLLMENVFVNGEFLSLLQKIKSLHFRKNTIITYGGVLGGYMDTGGPDMRDLVLNRADFLAKKPKRRPVDIALVAMQLLKDGIKLMTAKDFAAAIIESGAPLDDSLITEIVKNFSDVKSAKEMNIDIVNFVDYIQRKWPERKLPPTPPPEPEPEPEPKPAPVRAKGKKRKK